MGALLVRDLTIDPARAKELINPEFIADGPFLVTSNDRGSVGYRYEALPAALADEPSAFGCIVVEDERLGGPATLIAMLWDGVETRLHRMSPVVGSTMTVARRGEAASLTLEGQH